MRAFPTDSEMALAPGRYDASPPFAVPLAFDIHEQGWFSAHIQDDFLDVMRFDGPDPRAPTRWVAWALPTTIYGATTEPASGLTPESAAALISTHDGVSAGAVIDFEFAGLGGVQVDLSASEANTHIFGSEEGNFGLDPAYDMSFGFVDTDGQLLIVLCHDADEQNRRCLETDAILASAQL